MDWGLADRVVVLTGAAGGIGRALALAFLRAGTQLVLIDRPGSGVLDLGALFSSSADASMVNRAIHAPLCLEVELTEDAAVAEAAQRIEAQLSQVDVLINNAGIEYPTPLADPAADFMARWDGLMRNNTGTMVRLTRALQGLLPRGASVINQSSIWGHVGVPGFSAYVASKHAVLGLTRALAAEFGPRGVRVNAVCPGWIRTDAAMRSLDAMAREAGRPADALLAEILAQQAVPELLEPEDLAGTFLFLASPASRAVTGQSLVVSHGEVMH